MIGSAACVETVDLDQPAPAAAPERPSRPTQAASPLGASRTFTDEALGFSLDFPADWTLHDHHGQGGLIRADLSLGKDVGVQVRADRLRDADFEQYVERYHERFLSNMAEHWRGRFASIERECATLGAHPGCHLSGVLHRGDGQRWWLAQYLWRHGDRVIILETGAREDARGAYEPVLQAIAKSMRFDRPPLTPRGVS